MVHVRLPVFLGSLTVTAHYPRYLGMEDEPVPTSGDIARAVRLSRDVSWLLAGSLAGAGVLAGVGAARRRSAKLSGDA